MFEQYNVELIDKSYDGILGLTFSHKTSDYSFVLFSCYLPPENSTWGRDAVAFYSQTLSILYLHGEVDNVFICGDLNSSIGRRNDTISELDNVKAREIIDDTVKSTWPLSD